MAAEGGPLHLELGGGARFKAGDSCLRTLLVPG
jgi:hypothetical protein